MLFLTKKYRKNPNFIALFSKYNKSIEYINYVTVNSGGNLSKKYKKKYQLTIIMSWYLVDDA